MRNMIDEQTPLVERWIDKPLAQEYQLMSKVLDDAPEAIESVYECLANAGASPKRGRKTLSADQVLRILVVKMHEGVSYGRLAFKLADSSTFRTFCRLPFDCFPSKSALQRSIKVLTPECLETVHRAVVGVGLRDGMENGNRLRCDCTTTETNIHEPTDSSLLWDCCRVLTRLTHRAQEIGQLKLTFIDHCRKAKTRAIAILNARNDEQRVPLYEQLLDLAEQAILDAQRLGAALLEFPPEDMADQLYAQKLVADIDRFVPLAWRVISQAERRVLRGETVTASQKVFSIFEPHTDIIIKDRRETYYGHKLCLSEGGSGLILDVVVEGGNPADATLAVRCVERAHEITNKVFKKVAFDGGFASKSNVEQIKALGVEEVAFSKSRGIAIEDMVKNRRSYRKLRSFRAGIGATISWLKRCLGLSRCNWSGLQSFQAYALASVLSANLLVIARRRQEVAAKQQASAA